jgi:hypothetical protein
MLLVIATALSGCTTIKDPALRGGAVGDRTMVNGPDYPTSESGLVTVAEISPSSGIAILPPDMQHVVWRRDTSVIVAYGEQEKTSDEAPRASETKKTRPVRDRWPLLERDMDFDSEIRKLDMCDARNEGCVTNDCYMDLEPCEDPDRYSCFMTKPGNYCLEKENEK